MLFKTRFHDGLKNGSIVRSYRRWRSPKVKVGGRYRFATKDGIEVTSVETVLAQELTEEDARASGFDSSDDLWREIERSSRRSLEPDEELTCVHFRYSRMEPKAEPAVTVTAKDVGAMVDRIEAMENRSANGPWVWRTLSLISEHPRRRAGDLADLLDADRLPFKSRVRRLKALGLTESFEVGYALTALGEAVLRRSGKAD